MKEARHALIEQMQLGQRLAQQGQFVPAAELFQSLLDRGASDPAISVELGYALKDAGQSEAAAVALEQALKAAPENIRLLNAYGLVLTDLSRFEEALSAFQRACQADPHSAGSLGNLARTLLTLGRAHEAAFTAQQALVIDRSLIPALQTLRAALFEDGQIDAAIALCEKLVADHDGPEAAMGLRATCCEDLGRHEQALALWLTFSRTGRGGQQAIFNAALSALRLEDYRLGWQLWSQRALDRRADLSSYGFEVPQWTGVESLAGRSLFIYSEQGFGDCIQFVRYVPQLSAFAPREVTLAFPAPLEPLYHGFDAIRVLQQGDAVTRPDLQCSVASLPSCLLAAHGMLDIPAPCAPRVDASKVRYWSDRLGPKTRPRIGIAASGNPQHHNDRNRSMALEQLRPLASLGCELISLQRDLRDTDQPAARDMRLRSFGQEMADFGDAAALASLCERVVSVDSAPAHLAGSMGIETLLLLPALADWRWGISQERSVWYPSMRLFRQDQQRDWKRPVTQLMQALRG